jgi:predicted Rossmann fold nucleotide-binding protein DprA/Smf involved in DNA uptake
MVQRHYDRGCMQRRNRYMVDRSARLIAAYDGLLGGTMYTIHYAMRRGVDVVIVDVEET